MSDSALDLDELTSAEDFLEYFEIPYDPAVVHVNRLHILQRFHDYLDAQAGEAGDAAAQLGLYRSLLQRAYGDFVTSDARTEKVFKVFHMHEPREAFVRLDDLVT